MNPPVWLQTPAPGEMRPAPGETRPAPGETRPAPGETRPAPGETRPAPGETSHLGDSDFPRSCKHQVGPMLHRETTNEGQRIRDGV
jgi:hypothetical protein